VPRERIATVWASALASGKVVADIAMFTAKIAKLPHERLRSPRASTASSPSSGEKTPAAAERAP
jgi:hypothetical protein